MSGSEVQKWADQAMFRAAPMESNVPRVHLLWATPDPLGAIAAACRMYEGKPTYQMHEITDAERMHYWQEVQKTHLKAPLEFVKMHFFIEGVTRAFTHQMVRQRTAVYAQESLRFAVKDNLENEAQVPPSIVPLDEDNPKRVIWESAIREAGERYDALIAAGIPAEDARGLLPHATTTRLNYCTDLRALAEHAGNRLCTQAQFEWRFVFMGIVNALKNTRTLGMKDQWRVIIDPKMATLFAPVCYKLGRCPFTADFDRGCTIRGRVDEGKFDEIDPGEWMTDPRAGWVK